MKRRYTVALCQMDTRADREENLRVAARLLEEAAARGAALAAFPELFNVIDCGETPPEEIPNGPSVTRMAKLAAEHQIWVLCGSLYEKDPEGGRKYNTSVLLTPEGKVAAKYSKLHLFDVTLPDGSLAYESELVQPGREPMVADTPLGRLGMSICYDVRFPELYRWMALNGAQVFLVPAEFNLRTGKLHWETLLRARAIENGCYVIAPAQMGEKQTRNGPYPCYGSSMVVDPNGMVIARAPERVGVTLAEIDLDYVEQVRRDIPALKNRRRDVYQLNGL
ncbi:MAG: carbon-nitrogen hydrolase family protein [Oscillospiraceae bacterium]|nr:carbon-nitrogen hydrolase family protein [Oscillospiraceae bacterium]